MTTEHEVADRIRAVAAALGDPEADTGDIHAVAARADMNWNALLASALYRNEGGWPMPDPDKLGKFADAVDWSQFEQALRLGELEYARLRGATFLREVRINVALATVTNNDDPAIVHALAAAVMCNSPEAEGLRQDARDHLRQALKALGG